MRDVFIKTLTDLTKKNNKIILVTADLGFGVLDNYIKKFPKNFINVGVAEQNMIGVAVGLSKKGFNVFVYSLGNFPTLRCLEQIRNDAAYHSANVKIVNVGGGYSYGPLGFSHHATEDLSIVRSLPEVKIVSPFNSKETEEATKFLSKAKGVFYLRLDKKRDVDIGLETKKTILKPKFKFGKFSTIIKGKEIIIFAIGGAVNEAIKACEILKKKNLNPTLISCHTLKPLDNDEIKRLCKLYKKIFVIEENSIFGGLGSAISEVCMSNKIYCKVFKSLGIQNSFQKEVGDRNHLLKLSKLDYKSISQTILRSF